MPKRINIDKQAEYTVIGTKEKTVTKPKTSFKKKLFWAIVAVVLIVTVVCLTLYFTGVFDELQKAIHDRNNKEPEQAQNFVDYKFNANAMPDGKYATFTLVCDNKEYAFEVFLFSSYAPNTVNNFVTYADAGYYTNTVITDANIKYDAENNPVGGILRGGGYTMKSDGNYVQKIPTTFKGSIKGEFLQNDYKGNKLSHTAGVISMAREEGYDTATTEFFFCPYANTSLNGYYAAFGKITTDEGIVALQTVTKLAYEQNKTVTVKSVKIMRKTVTK